MKKFILRFPALLVLVCFLLLQGCEKEEENVHPEVNTTRVTALSPSSARMEGTIIQKGKYNVLDHGFIYGFQPGISDMNGYKLSLGKDVKEGSFTKDLTDINAGGSYYYDKTLYVRAYLTNERGTVLGQVVNVMLPSPNVKSIEPTSGKAGDKITINGNFYATSPDQVLVQFGGVNAKILEAGSAQIVAEIPEGISISSYYTNNNYVAVSLTIAGQTHNVTSTFNVIPTIKEFSPSSGFVGSSITLSGSNIPTYNPASRIKVYLGDREAGTVSLTNAHLRADVPYDMTSKEFTITVVIDGVKTVLPGKFTITPHTVTSISPASGLAGSSFSIFGSEFPYFYYDNTTDVVVKVGDITVGSTYTSSEQLDVILPTNIPVGSHKVSVTIGPHTIEAPQLYKVIPHAVSSFSPASGGVGKVVTFKGNFLTGSYYNVYFGSAATSAYCESSNTLQASVPHGAAPGKVKITLKHEDVSFASKDEFTVLAPIITSFAPNAGVAGSVVTITGSGFTSDPYTVVKFGTVATSILSMTDTAIKVVVPSNVIGAMKISVTQHGQTIISTDNFTGTN